MQVTICDNLTDCTGHEYVGARLIETMDDKDIENDFLSRNTQSDIA